MQSRYGKSNDYSINSWYNPRRNFSFELQIFLTEFAGEQCSAFLRLDLKISDAVIIMNPK